MRWHRELQRSNHGFVVGNQRENLSFHLKDAGKHKVEQKFSSSGFSDELCQTDLFADGAQFFAFPTVPVGELQPPPMMDVERSPSTTPLRLASVALP